MAVESYNNLPSPSAPTTGQPTLTSGYTAGGTTFDVSSNTNAPAAAPFRCSIDDEIFYVTARPGLTWTAAGAQEGTIAANHLSGATVVVAGFLSAAGFKNNPLALTTTGDLPYLNSSGNQARLAVGAAGTILTVGSGLPAWSATPAIGTSLLVGAGTNRTTLNVFSTLTAEYTASDAVAGNVIFQKARGTVGSEALVNSADVLGNLLFRGYDGTSTYASYAGNSARIRAVATEAFDASGHGAKLEFATVAVDSTTLTLRATLDDAALTLSAGLALAGAISSSSYSASHSLKGSALFVGFVSGNDGFINLTTANVAAQGTDQNQTGIAIVGAVDTGASKYGNAVVQGYLRNSVAGGSQYLYFGEAGWEGTLSDAGVRGVTGLTHFYIWDNLNLRTVFEHAFQPSTPASVTDTGLRVGSVFNKTFTYTTVVPLVKNDGTTATYDTLLLHPIFNTGGSNTSTTVNVLDIDTTNTAVTGLTVNLIKASYGGTQRFNIDSLGGIAAVTDIGGGLDLKLAHTSADASGVSLVQLKARGTVGSEALVNSGDTLGSFQFRGFDGTTYSTYVSNSARIRVLTTEAFDSTHHGAKLEFATCANAATTLVTQLTIDSTGLTLADAANLIVNTTTGTKIATATGQKLGFWGVTPVVQQVFATGASHTVDELITVLQTIGIVKQS